MKHLRSFKTYESIIVPNLINSNLEIDSYSDLVKYGKENGFDVVEYDEFYKSLPESDRKSAPPRTGGPFFALFHPINKKAMFVVCDRRFFEGPPPFPPHMLRIAHPPRKPPYKEIVNDIIGHEMIHKSQSERRKVEYALPSPMERKNYFSNKDEIMAFSWSIANEISKNSESITGSLKKINRNPIWSDIKKICDNKVQNRYKKYIYLYLENIFKSKNETH